MRSRSRAVFALLSAALLVACADESTSPQVPVNPAIPSGGTPDAGTSPRPNNGMPAGVPMMGMAPPTRASERPQMASMASGATIGSACTSDTDCRDGLCLLSDTIPGGYCSMLCGGDLISSGPSCPDGSACVQVGEAASVCLDQCGGNNGTCRSMYACEPVDRVTVCTPACVADEECKVDETCNEGTGLCEPSATRRPAKIGQACNTDQDCASMLCLSEQASNGSFPGGYCVKGCTAGEANKPCAGGDGICMELPRGDGTTGYACLGACNTGVDCRPQYMCSADVSVQSPDGIGMCLPRCDHYVCDTGTTCDATVGICVEGTMTPTPAQSDDVSLATLQYGASSNQTVTVNVPQGATSFTITADPGGETKVQLTRLHAPNGEVLFDGYKPLANVMLPPLPVGSGAQSLIFPSSPRLNLVPGPYKVDVWSQGNTQVKVDAIFRRQSGVSAGGSLPVILWFAQQRYVDAASAPNDATLQRAIGIVKAIYANVDIELGPFSYRDVPGSAAQRYAVLEDIDGQISALYAELGPAQERALNFVMIDSYAVDFAKGGTLYGVAAGIPGPPAGPGRARKGVTVALAPLYQNAETLAEVMAHEAGHYFGLFHTTEQNGGSFDPLLDTPECSARFDTNDDGFVTATECAGRGADNMMFWAKAPSGQRLLSNDQRYVLLRNPSIQ